MRFAALTSGGKKGLAVGGADGIFRRFCDGDSEHPGSLDSLIGKDSEAPDAAAAVVKNGPAIDLKQNWLLPPIQTPGKIISVGLNYVENWLESGFTPPGFPAISARFTFSRIGAGSPSFDPKPPSGWTAKAEWLQSSALVDAILLKQTGSRVSSDTPSSTMLPYATFR
ncbi:MAG TPA: hypothetical protein VL991_10765 [Terracidiphilus sp.]|nr:hypothetical protein [Terracidiphilus sp.]